MNRLERIRNLLQQEFSTETLTVRDRSELHRGHAGWQPGGETHVSIVICAKEFATLTLLERHRRVLAALQTEFTNGLHAIQIEATTPDTLTTLSEK